MTIIINDHMCGTILDTLVDDLWSTTDANNRLIVYKGTMPLDADDYIEANFTSDVLCTFANFDTVRSSGLIYTRILDPAPASVTATGTGTAAWFAMFATTSTSRVILGDVTEDGGGGLLTIGSVNITSGATVTFVNFAINSGVL